MTPHSKAHPTSRRVRFLELFAAHPGWSPNRFAKALACTPTRIRQMAKEEGRALAKGYVRDRDGDEAQP